MKFKIIMCSFVLFLASCATTHPGQEGTSLTGGSNLPLKISAQTIENAKGQSFQLIELTLENTSDNWLKINRSKIVIGNPTESKLSVVMGRDLRDWAQAMNLRLKQEEQNKQMVQLGLVALGSVAVVAGSRNSDPGLEAAGAVVVAGTYAWAVGDVISQSIASAEQGDKVPENHIYQSFSVPGKMFLRKWVLLNKPSSVLVNNLVIEFETIEGERNSYEIKL